MTNYLFITYIHRNQSTTGTQDYNRKVNKQTTVYLIAHSNR